MRRVLHIFLLSFLGMQVAAQQPEAGALRRALAAATDDTTRVALLPSLTELYAETKPDSSYYYADQLIVYARKMGFTLSEVFALMQEAYVHMNAGNYPRALQTLLTALALAENPGSEVGSLPVRYLDTTRYQKRPITPYLQRIGLLGRVHQVLGVLYGNNNDTGKALLHYRLGIRYGEESGEVRAQLETYLTLGRYYLSLKKTDSALYCEKKAYALSQLTGYVKYIGSILLNTARVYEALDNKPLAIQYLRRAAEENTKQNYLRGVVAGDLLLASLYNTPDTRDSSLHYANSALAVASYLNFPDLLLRSYTALAAVYKATNNNDSTVKYQDKIIWLNDSLANSRRSQQFQNIDFDAQQQLQQMQATKEAYRNRLQMYALVGGLLVLLTAAVFLWRNSQQRKQANLLLQTEKQTVEQTLEQLKATQAQLIQAEKMASLGELTAGIAHEIQNPLNFVNNFSSVNKELLQEMKQEINNGNFSEVITIAADLEANEEKIAHHGQRADSIVKGMLQHAKASTGEKQPTDINKLADEYLRLSYQGTKAKDKAFNASIRTNFDNTIGDVNIEAQDIGQVLLNLFNNAFYAVNAKKQQLNRTFEPVVSVSTKREDDAVHIVVKDNGMGMSQQVMNKVFQPFFTTKPTGEGTGLGLSLSYDIITKGHGGTLSVQSTEGEGSEFVVTLPIQKM